MFFLFLEKVSFNSGQSASLLDFQFKKEIPKVSYTTIVIISMFLVALFHCLLSHQNGHFSLLSLSLICSLKSFKNLSCRSRKDRLFSCTKTASLHLEKYFFCMTHYPRSPGSPSISKKILYQSFSHIGIFILLSSSWKVWFEVGVAQLLTFRAH